MPVERDAARRRGGASARERVVLAQQRARRSGSRRATSRAPARSRRAAPTCTRTRRSRRRTPTRSWPHVSDTVVDDDRVRRARSGEVGAARLVHEPRDAARRRVDLEQRRARSRASCPSPSSCRACRPRRRGSCRRDSRAAARRRGTRAARGCCSSSSATASAAAAPASPCGVHELDAVDRQPVVLELDVCAKRATDAG